MIVDRSDQVPRLKWPRRFPVPRDFGVAKTSRIVEGKSWPTPEGATRIDTFRVDLDDCKPMLADD